MFAYYPAVMLSNDSPRYARVGMPLFGDFWMPAGYPMFLRLLHVISHQLWFTIAVQHVLGVLVGVFVLLIMRRVGLSRGWACITASVPWFSGDCLYLEHQVMADSFFLFVVTAGVTIAVFAIAGGLRTRLLGLAGAVLCFAGLVRSVGIVLPVLLAFVVILFQRNKRGLAATGATLAGAGATFATYLVIFVVAHGQYLGLSDMTGWNFYCRIAPFADCRRFSAPSGTEMLCETRPPRERPGPFGYVWDLDSVPRKTFALGPDSGRLLERFALQALLHQPADYLKAVATDLARYVAPHFAARPYSGQPPEILSFGWRDLGVERQIILAMKQRYRGVRVSVHNQELLAAYQNVVRVHGVLIVLLCAGCVCGYTRASADQRFVLTLCGLTALALYLVPVLTYSYDFRYGVPAQTPLAIAGVIGLAALSGSVCRPSSN